jgi:type II secretory pathway component PulM
MDDGRLERIERRMEELDQRESAMEKAMDTAMARSRAAMSVIVPTETRKHVRASWRHNLLAVRSMIDHWAERLNDGTDDHSTDSTGSATRDAGRENIPID